MKVLGKGKGTFIKMSAADRGVVDEIILALNTLGKEKIISYDKEMDWYRTKCYAIKESGIRFVTHIKELIDFFNSHHFDWRGLIPMGLALEALEGMYNILKEE